MTINFSAALNAYANAGKVATGSGGGATAATGGDSFAKMLQDTGANVVDTLKQGETASMQAVTGKADLTQVTAAISNAEVALQTVVAVRDRVISAYQDIIKMPM